MLVTFYRLVRGKQQSIDILQELLRKTTDSESVVSSRAQKELKNILSLDSMPNDSYECLPLPEKHALDELLLILSKLSSRVEIRTLLATYLESTKLYDGSIDVILSLILLRLENQDVDSDCEDYLNSALLLSSIYPQKIRDLLPILSDMLSAPKKYQPFLVKIISIVSNVTSAYKVHDSVAFSQKMIKMAISEKSYVRSG